MLLNNLLTEQRNPYTINIDTVSTLEMCMLLNEEDKRGIAIRNILPQIAKAIDEIDDFAYKMVVVYFILVQVLRVDLVF